MAFRVGPSAGQGEDKETKAASSKIKTGNIDRLTLFNLCATN